MFTHIVFAEAEHANASTSQLNNTFLKRKTFPVNVYFVFLNREEAPVHQIAWRPIKYKSMHQYYHSV